MSNTVRVVITARATAKFSKTVQMEKTDYDKYLQICAEWSSTREVEEQIKEIAFKYDFAVFDDDIEDIDDPEYIEFELVK
ncbi:hypothetical protein G3755_004072 [Salmonella enterica]|uniref:hypothetical protein n=1 Tax=Salmonella sp. SKLX119062 TaxID=3160090 RepID=UPI00127E773F|nr:hypothetical protein [Salmonella enterica subsp. enterica serovar Hvittingfoss]EAY8715183.1 hypothetical protein [Salmonella enterica]EDH7692067.1 hypothetical protein [Salmonella enterica subsp. enterica serovar Stanley]EDS5035188.1 hypothetical protein [Salmonella enterica subsp. enterica serovar Wandsworth]EDV9851830.1 hypothetical protein [Salmonella enterica subsp. enterica serovar Java]